MFVSCDVFFAARFFVTAARTLPRRGETNKYMHFEVPSLISPQNSDFGCVSAHNEQLTSVYFSYYIQYSGVAGERRGFVVYHRIEVAVQYTLHRPGVGSANDRVRGAEAASSSREVSSLGEGH